MSAAAPARPGLRRPAAPVRSRPVAKRQQLSVVPSRAAAAHPATHAGRLPFALLLGAILAAGLIALLLLHTLAAQDGFTLRDLQRRSAALAETQQQLTVANQQAQSPVTLAAQAHKLGMFPTGSITVVHRGGRVIGVGHPAPPPPKPAPSATPSASPSAAATKPQQKPTSGASPKPTAAKTRPRR